MSKQKKVRRARPNTSAVINVPVSVGPTSADLPRSPAPDRRNTGPVFDYTHVKKDLTRIGILAASFITIFVILSFFLNR